MHKDGDGPGPQISRQLDWEPAFRNQHVDVALRKDLSPSSLCGSSCGIQQKRVQESRARGAETLQRRRDAAWDMEPGCIDIEHLRYRHTISKVQNVDIEWAFDIEVFVIECFARYVMSDTRYRGGKDVSYFRTWTLAANSDNLKFKLNGHGRSESAWAAAGYARAGPGQPGSDCRRLPVSGSHWHGGHLEPCRPSISKVWPSISLYYDIKGATFDIVGRTWKTTFNIGCNMTTRY